MIDVTGGGLQGAQLHLEYIRCSHVTHPMGDPRPNTFFAFSRDVPMPYYGEYAMQAGKAILFRAFRARGNSGESQRAILDRLRKSITEIGALTKYVGLAPSTLNVHVQRLAQAGMDRRPGRAQDKPGGTCMTLNPGEKAAAGSVIIGLFVPLTTPHMSQVKRTAMVSRMLRRGPAPRACDMYREVGSK
jgi:hypothetical protein